MGRDSGPTGSWIDTGTSSRAWAIRSRASSGASGIPGFRGSNQRRFPRSKEAAPILAFAGAILVAHVGMDCAVGYGLKLGSGFGDTHLGHMGKARRPGTLAGEPAR